jgi:hypothetical protein
MPKIIRAVNRVSGLVVEGDALTVNMVRYLEKNPDHFRLFYDEAEEQMEVEAAAAETVAPGRSMDTSYSKGELMSYTRDTLVGIAQKLGVSVIDSMNKKDICDLIIAGQGD